MQMLLKLVEITSVSSFEGHIKESSQTKAKIANLIDKNDIEAYLTIFERLMEVHVFLVLSSSNIAVWMSAASICYTASAEVCKYGKLKSSYPSMV